MIQVPALQRWMILRWLAASLRPLIGGAPEPIAGHPWHAAIEAASYNRIGPALGWCWSESEDLPEDVRGYFAANLLLNLHRNEAILDSLERSLAALNAVGVVPVLLKGAGMMADAAYPTPAVRMLGDLDILVPEQQLDAARTALLACGISAEGPDRTPPHHHHLPMLIDAATGAGIELHRRVVPYAERICPTAAMYDARLIDFRGCQARIPNPTSRIAHHLVHGQIVDGRHMLRSLCLAQTLDLAIMVRKYGGAIDWELLEKRFADSRRLKVLQMACSLCDLLFATATPFGRFTSRTERQLRSALAQPAWRRSVSIVLNRVRGAAEQGMAAPKTLTHLTPLGALRRNWTRLRQTPSPW